MASSELKRLENDLKNNEELREKLDALCKQLGEDKLTGDSAIMTKAGNALGYEFTIAELEQHWAEVAVLDPEEMELVTGGKDENKKKEEKKHGLITDEYGHDFVCVAAWHCNTAFMHTETTYNQVVCWKDYCCNFINKPTPPLEL